MKHVAHEYEKGEMVGFVKRNRWIMIGDDHGEMVSVIPVRENNRCLLYKITEIE